MPARILVVDDVPTNIKLLEARLSEEYFEVFSATSAEEAIEIARDERPDLIILDIMMPGMDGFEACQILKREPDTRHIPIVIVTALNSREDRLRGLEAGADDFISKPVDNLALFARIRSLIRLKMMTDELRKREQTSKGFGQLVDIDPKALGNSGKILVVEDDEISARRMSGALAPENKLVNVPTASMALKEAGSGQYDLIIVSLNIADSDSLRLCSALRASEVTRRTPIILLIEDSDYDRERLIKAFELGVSDFVQRPLEENELLARARTQLRRRHYEERLRQNYHASLALAVSDDLTGLHNRPYLEAHLEQVLNNSETSRRPACLLVLEADHFPAINTTYGQTVGELALRSLADRIRRGMRGIDLAARVDEYKFMIVMPDTTVEIAGKVAERLRAEVEENPVRLQAPENALGLTVSIGVAESDGTADNRQALTERAEEALSAAKSAGYNQVVAL